MTRRLTAALLLPLGLCTAQAWAHAKPQQESPAANATVSAPAQVSITFTEALEPAFSTLTVNDAKGSPVTKTKASLDGSPKKLTLPLPALSAGVYTVNWVAVAADGHRSHGSYTFTVK